MCGHFPTPLITAFVAFGQLGQETGPSSWVSIISVGTRGSAASVRPGWFSTFVAAGSNLGGLGARLTPWHRRGLVSTVS